MQQPYTINVTPPMKDANMQKRRWELRHWPPEDVIRDLHQHCRKLEETPMQFAERSYRLSEASARLAAAAGNVLKDYPEVQLHVLGSISRHEADQLEPQEMMVLAEKRATIVAQAIQRAGFVGQIIRRRSVPKAFLEKHESALHAVAHGIFGAGLAMAHAVGIGHEEQSVQHPLPPSYWSGDRTSDFPSEIPLVHLEIPRLAIGLLNPAARLEMLLKRNNFGFKAGGASLSPQGLLVASAIAAIAEEEGRPLQVSVELSSPQLAFDRAEAVVQGIRKSCVRMTAKVIATDGSADLALVSFANSSNLGRPQLDDPNPTMQAVLQRSPLGFRPNSSDLAPDAVPVMRQVAKVLCSCAQEDWVLVLEAHARENPLPNAGNTVTMVGLIDRCERILDHLRAEGVSMRIVVREFPSKTGNPCIVFNCVEPGEEYRLTDDAGSFDDWISCSGNGGMNCSFPLYE